MAVEVLAQTSAILADYGCVPIAFRVESRFRVETIDNGLGGMALVEETVVPYVKDYDLLTGEGPSHWQECWDICHWGFLCAFDAGELVGGAAVAWNTRWLNILQGRDDVAALWDLRVRPDHRRGGIGRQLFNSAVAWARARQCTCFIAETQNINVPACRFYARQGCELGAINRYAYAAVPDEVQLLWQRGL